MMIPLNYYKNVLKNFKTSKLFGCQKMIAAHDNDLFVCLVVVFTFLLCFLFFFTSNCQQTPKHNNIKYTQK